MRLTMLFSFVLLAILCAMPAAAQAPDTLQVAVPFAFTVHNVPMPAGDYRVTRSADGSGLVTLENIANRETVTFLASQTTRSTPAQLSSVSFRAEGTNFSVADVWWAGYASGARLQSQRDIVLTAGLQETAMFR